MIRGIKAIFRGIYSLFATPASRIGLGVLVTGGFLAGALFWGGFNYGMEKTNEEEFCLSCHTMKDNLLPELQKTVHWQNRTGVRAGCPDCHVPHSFTDKIARKMQASREVWGEITGTIDTREKFQDRRLILAQREWARLKANDSKECRNCHDYDSMDFSKMRVTSQMVMHRAAENNTSCIDCHKGIAHQLPDMKGARNPLFDTLVSAAHGLSLDNNKDYYSVTPQELFADEGLSQSIGSLEVATPVKVLRSKGDAVEIEMSMWRKNKGFGRVLYGNFGLNITNAILHKEFASDAANIRINDSKTDELTGLEWQHVTVHGWIEKGHLVESPEQIWDVARASYTQSCSVCHRPPAEAGHDANQWPGLFAGMVGFTNMDDDTAKLVLKYLQTHSSDFVKGDKVVH